MFPDIIFSVIFYGVRHGKSLNFIFPEKVVEQCAHLVGPPAMPGSVLYFFGDGAEQQPQGVPLRFRNTGKYDNPHLTDRPLYFVNPLSDPNRRHFAEQLFRIPGADRVQPEIFGRQQFFQ